MKNIDSWLRIEAEKLEADAKIIEKKIVDTATKRNYDKLNMLVIQHAELRSQYIKLYEMLGRLSEIKD